MILNLFKRLSGSNPDSESQTPPAAAQRSAPVVNSRDWLNHQFETAWEANNGPAQSRYFMNELITYLPGFMRDFFNFSQPSILDWGCAMGDGVDVLRENCPKAKVTGLDISDVAIARAQQRFPTATFIRSDNIPQPFDVIVNSNCLEYFPDPMAVVQEQLKSCRQFYIALVPYQESPLPEGHRSTFDENSFPKQLGSWRRMFTEQIKGKPPFWSGQLLLVVYEAE